MHLFVSGIESIDGMSDEHAALEQNKTPILFFILFFFHEKADLSF